MSYEEELLTLLKRGAATPKEIWEELSKERPISRAVVINALWRLRVDVEKEE